MKTHAWNQFASFHSLATAEDLVCLSRIRWRWADPRLRSLLGMAARQWRVFFVEITPPAWLDAFELRQTHKQVIRVGATRNGVWTVRPALPDSDRNEVVNKALAKTLKSFFQEAGIHEPVIWHLDAAALEASHGLPAWSTLYLKPEPQAIAFRNAKEHQAEASLRERSDCLIDSNMLSKPASEGWNEVCSQIMHAACRRQGTCFSRLASI